MNTRRFITGTPRQNNHVQITGDEFYHLKTVMRKGVGDDLEVVNGKGSLWTGKIVTMAVHQATIQILEEIHTSRPPLQTIIAPSLLKKKSMTLLIEKLSEMGIDEIRPVIYNRSDVPYNDSMLTKWKKIALQSIKVNRRLWVTDVYAPVDLGSIIEFAAGMKTKLLLTLDGDCQIPLPLQVPIISIIGPPGDLVKEEKERIVENGFIPLNMSPCVLKSETAAFSIAAVLKHSLPRPVA